MSGDRTRVRQARRLRSRRIRAVLAGGVVLGIGATATLAAWNDSEYTTATITAGTFGIVGSVDGSTFGDHPAGAPATLGFSMPAGAMTPGATVYALLRIKTAAGSLPATLQLRADPGNTAGLGQYLTYGVRTVAGATCDAQAFAAGTAVVATGSALTADGSGTQHAGANGAGPVTYCFAVTMPAATGNGAQGLTAAVHWHVDATSAAP
ncbi:SipW-dependent-type signal peptide-containing protein [Microbacterium luticocti]|uniref:SipW-dependent-type signal peptide-containing protein n=1 Tax=Microbacterium luticocti TaxID=451764 RepID=UPI0003F861CF|nr:SipW-dependent-type signal peptide-containing protein [Microbacterium luticocti]